MKTKAIPDGFHSLTPYISVKGASDAIEFYKKAFGAKEIGRLTMPDGSIGHAEIQIGDSRIMLSEESPEWGNLSPQTLGDSTVNLCLYVEDVDAIFNRALREGARVLGQMEVKDQFYGDRSGSLIDPFGHKWTITTHKEDVSFEEMQKRSDALFKQSLV
jgi:PhnB protein